MGFKARTRLMSTAARRARLGVRHHLARPARSVDQVAGDLVGLHSSDPATVYLSAWARVDGFEIGDLEAALYERRALARMLGMRRTMFVVPVGLAAVMNAACTRALVAGERKRLVGLIESHDLARDGERWLARVERATLAALADRGTAVARDLVADVPELANKLYFGKGKKWAGSMGMSTRVLFLLATGGKILRARPRGSWISSQYEWALTETWLESGVADVETDEARTELVRRWLRAFGPGTLADIKWWTGWPKGQTERVLATAGAEEIGVDGAAAFVLAGDVEPAHGETWVALLPSLDPTTMGWKERDWYIGDHAAALFDRNGNAGPMVWLDGRVVGGWAQRRGGEVVFELLERVSSEAEERVRARAEALTAWLGDVRVSSRFPTPLEKELRG